MTATWTERNWWIIFDQTSRTPINQQIPTHKSISFSLSLSPSLNKILAIRLHPSPLSFFLLLFRLNFAGIGKHDEMMVVRDRRLIVDPSRGASFSYYDELRLHHRTQRTIVIRQVRQTLAGERWIMPTYNIYMHTTRWRFVIRRDNRLQSSSLPVRSAYPNIILSFRALRGCRRGWNIY